MREKFGSVMSVVLLLVACVMLSSIGASMAKADTEYPVIDTSWMQPQPGVELPIMPWFWPIVLPEDEPSTPVPAVPTAEMIYQSQLARVLQIGEEIDRIDGELALLRFLLGLDPNGANAQMIQTQIQMLETQKATLEEERQSLREEMLGSP